LFAFNASPITKMILEVPDNYKGTSTWCVGC